MRIERTIEKQSRLLMLRNIKLLTSPKSRLALASETSGSQSSDLTKGTAMAIGWWEEWRETEGERARETLLSKRGIGRMCERERKKSKGRKKTRPRPLSLSLSFSLLPPPQNLAGGKKGAGFTLTARRGKNSLFLLSLARSLFLPPCP